MTHQNRRTFIKTVAAGAAGATLLRYFDLKAATLDSAAGHSLGGLTSYAVLEDSANLASQSNLVSENIASLVLADPNVNIASNLSRFGAMIQVSETEVQKSLNKHVAEMKTLMTASPENEEMQEQLDVSQRKVSLLLGWYLATGVREVLAPVYEPNPKLADRQPTEMAIYHDMEVLRQRAGTGASISTAEVEALFNGLQPRMIARTHTLTPDYDDGIDWTVRVSHWRDDTMQLMQEYADAFVKPHPEKVKLFITDMNFYDANEPVLQLAKTARKGGSVNSNELKTAMSQAQSIYAKSVAKGIEALAHANALLNQ